MSDYRIDEMIAAFDCDPTGYQVNPITGRKWMGWEQLLQEEIESAERALGARAQFETERDSGWPPLPLNYGAREDIKCISAIGYMVAAFAGSWATQGYSSDHPSFQRYASGVLASPLCPDFLHPLDSLFPPNSLNYINGGLHWGPSPQTCSKYK